ncbi:DUF421 domain-containing protein [Lyngbya confervoides]|uniref:DUF421 domain-containing protein n=1 Tax=Lyngbya confervoides BDU141951 TaxID=1574623 RepID=A0ABD4T7C1_9CYAN|nr:YetF domain-containing protein [Lyngbya confervoides]MCM1984405.1 DUF421 domain-containing protein [Lyngbya confervoides BDU141951]
MFNSVGALLNTLLAASLSYIAIIVLLRISGKRTLAKWNAFDFVVTIAFGSILATTLLSQQTSVLQGMLGVALLMLYQFLLTWSAARSPLVQRFIKAKPTLLMHRGSFLNQALRSERVTQGEVLAAVRNQGIGDLAEVQAVILETDGSFSVVTQLREGSALRDVAGFS